MTRERQSVLVVGHGSRSLDAQHEFLKTVELMQSKNIFSDVRAAFMELCEPSIDDMVGKLVKDGFTDILVVPYFLFTGNHIKNDIPEILDNLRVLHPDILIKLAKPIGFEPSIADILIQRAHDLEFA